MRLHNCPDRRTIKKLLVAVATVAILAGIGAGYWFYRSLDQIAKSAIEHFGSAATQTQVRVDRVKLSLEDGSGMISGLTVGNPRGFKTATAVKADAVKIAVDPASIAGDVLVIRSIDVAAPRISYESGEGGSNFDVLLKNIGRNAGRDADAKTPGRKLIIDRLVIRDATLSYTSAITAGRTLTIPLADIRLSGIGRSAGGVAPGELAMAIVEALLDRIKRALALDVIQRGVQGLFGK